MKYNSKRPLVEIVCLVFILLFLACICKGIFSYSSDGEFQKGLVRHCFLTHLHIVNTITKLSEFVRYARYFTDFYCFA